MSDDGMNFVFGLFLLTGSLHYCVSIVVKLLDLWWSIQD